MELKGFYYECNMSLGTNLNIYYILVFRYYNILRAIILDIIIIIIIVIFPPFIKLD